MNHKWPFANGDACHHEAVTDHIDAASEDFVLTVRDVFLLKGRGSVVIGPIQSGVLRSGDEVEVHDGGDLVMAVTASVEFICGPGVSPDDIALLLRGVETPDRLKAGQTILRRTEQSA